MRKTFAIFLFLAGFLAFREAEAQSVWAGKDGNIRNIDTRGLVADKGTLYLATSNEVYVAADPSDKWEPVFALPSGDNQISCIAGKSKYVYVGTRRGLYKSDDRGRAWKNVFRTIIPDKNNILAIGTSKTDASIVMIGTEKGVFLSTDAGSSWIDASGTLKNKRIKCVLVGNGIMYAGGDGGLYMSTGLEGGWERIYIKSSVERPDISETQDGDTYEDSEGYSGINCITLSDKVVYAGIGRDIFSSCDSGRTWVKFPGAGLYGSVSCIAAAPKSDSVYCATTKGVFEYDKDREIWNELYKGIDKALSITSLTVSDDGKSLWASTDQGLYRLESGRYVADNYIDVEKNLKDLRIIFDNEPAFDELRRAAIDYADVNPDKIKKWQRESRLKALAPRVSLGWDKNTASNYEIYTSATKDYVTVGPEDISSGMDVSVSWDVAGLIWSDDQTNIDVRSRLMVQLRNDILDDLRRVYFERKRLQFDLMVNPPKDLKSRFEKEARIQELTQNIDDLTGCYFSKHMKK